MKIKILKSIIFLFLLLIIVPPVFADVENTATNSGTERKSENSRERNNVFENLRERLFKISKNEKQNNEEDKLRSCQARSDSVKKKTEQLIKMATNMETKFSSISARVQDYYTSKVVPSGKSLSNYNSLVSDITNKKDAVDTALAKAKVSGETFSCESDDPKSLFTTFREDMKAVKNALKEYRTSIKNLIVAIRTLSSEPESD